LYLKKTVMLSPCDPVGSAMKAMQTEIENLTKEIDKVLQAAQSYVDAVSQVASQISDVAGQIGDIVESDCPSDAIGAAADVAGDIQALLEQYAPKLATHTKVIMDKIGEYTSKIFNAEIAPLADVMFPNQRFQFLDMKIEINETFKCLFSGITDGLSDSILGALMDSLDLCNPSEDATETSPGTAPFVPICSVEKLVGDVIATNLTDIEQTVEDALGSVGTFLDDIQAGLGELTGLISGIKIPDINASIASALSFENITLDIFGCDLKPNCAVSDFYTLQEGGGAAEEAQLPSASGLAEEAAKGGELPKPTTTDYATPVRSAPG
jgi:phage-related protein